MAANQTADDSDESSVDLPVRIEDECDTWEDPVEGTVGTVVKIVEFDCPECGYDRGKMVTQILPGVTNVGCRRCGYMDH